MSISKEIEEGRAGKRPFCNDSREKADKYYFIRDFEIEKKCN
jgi:hypothetical protein